MWEQTLTVSHPHSAQFVYLKMGAFNSIALFNDFFLQLRRRAGETTKEKKNGNNEAPNNM